MVLKCKIKEKQDSEGGAGEPNLIEKKYTYEELKELQSKLTLVAGDKQKANKDTIKQFEEVMNRNIM